MTIEGLFDSAHGVPSAGSGLPDSSRCMLGGVEEAALE